MRITIIVLVVAILLGASAAFAADVKADRTPLTYKDSGLYCNLQFWHVTKPETDGITSMLTDERAATGDSPWTFYITQGAAARHADLVRKMAANGKKVIVRADIGHMKANPSVDEMEKSLVKLLTDIDPDWLYAITLGEEQVYWDGWDKALTELYHRAKKRWPKLPVYQWWTPMAVPNTREKSGWTALPADGWVIDLYGMTRQAFEKKVVTALETGKPLIHIVWSSPDWPNYSGAKSWDEGGRKIFDDQLDVCRAHNVPVAHFCTQDAVRVDGKMLADIRWGWHSVSPVVRDWYRQIEVMAENNKRLPDTAVGYRTLDKRLFDWAHANDSPQGLTFSLDDQKRKQINARIPLDRVPLKEGEHAVDVGEASKYFRLTCSLDSTAADLKEGMGVVGVAGRTAGATLTFKLEPLQPLSNLTVTGDIYAHRSLGGSASIASSADGVNWSEPETTKPEETNHSPTVRRRGDQSKAASEFSQEPVWIRVRLNSGSGVVTDTAASLSALVVSAAVEPMLK